MEKYTNFAIGYRITQFRALKAQEQGKLDIASAYQIEANNYSKQLDADVLDKLQWELARAVRKWRRVWLAEVSK